MLTAQWQEQIESLKQELADEIATREKVSERTVPSYICINNLKSKLNRLKEIADILSIEKYKLVFIGTVGEGKTTAICHLFNLLGNFTISKNIAGKTRSVTEIQELLANRGWQKANYTN
jgi:signal recognition particle GTPase